MRILLLLLVLSGSTFADEFFPIVISGMEVSLFAREPMVRNPCAIAFDARGRLCVGMGPQYRNPRQDTPGDSVYILIDDDGDGQADRSKEFATGLNCIQSLAWRGDELWIANSPDLTVVRDLDGDDKADEYVRLYTDLGNLEHALHGLNWGPDGKLYMSKGNSKGLTQPPERIAPKAFRDLWGITTENLPDFPPPVRFNKNNYKHNYHDPQDDWGREGGILRCNPDGSHLEIVARGLRNPWDITFDDGFDWLGTDNDQTGGDKIIAPFFGAHFGWGHSWSFDWLGENHLPTVPASGPLFEGSGAGVIYCGLQRYPENLRGVFLINDWLQRQVYIFSPRWDGARLMPQQIPLPLLASAGTGRTMERSRGRKFDPVDIEIGPDEAIYISSWGRQYGAEFRENEQVNEGRIYKLWPKFAPPLKWRLPSAPISEWPVETLLEHLGSHLPVWRVNAQEELIRRRRTEELLNVIEQKGTPQALQTWALWTIGRMNVPDQRFIRDALDGSAPLNIRLQSLRILAHRKSWTHALTALLEDQDARIRREAVLALRQSERKTDTAALLQLVAREKDRIVYYTAWGALGQLLSEPERRALLNHSAAGIRQAALLSLLEEGRLAENELQPLTHDSFPSIAQLARQRLSGSSQIEIRGRPLPVPEAGHTSVKINDVLPLLRTADAARGHDLFFDRNAAGCTACHRIGGAGALLAPDLSTIGLRAEYDFIVQSILDPSAVITEGFASQTFTTRDDRELTGIVAEESGIAITLVLASGQTVTIPRDQILSRVSSHSSGMPGNFGELLSAQQVADIAVFLKTIPEFSVQRQPGSFDIRLGTNGVMTYLFAHPMLTRPALVNVRTAAGIPVTREFPAPKSADHRWMHPGLAISFGWLNGHDYWRMKAPVRHKSFLREPVVADKAVSWTVRDEYLTENATEIVCNQDTAFQLSCTPDGLLLKIESEFYNDQRDFSFGDQEESGLCLRVPPNLTVQNGGTILNDRGEKNEPGTWGKPFRWIDYSGLVENQWRAGILIVPSPENPGTCWSHSRDYGVLVANPFPKQPHERPQPFTKTLVKKGERFHLGYSVLIYEEIRKE
jgi:putative membrane-bound dehydrogenase-like protein